MQCGVKVRGEMNAERCSINKNKTPIISIEVLHSTPFGVVALLLGYHRFHWWLFIFIPFGDIWYPLENKNYRKNRGFV